VSDRNELLLDIVVDHPLDHIDLFRGRQRATDISDIVTGNDRVYGGFEVHVKIQPIWSTLKL